MHATWKMVHRRRLHLWVEYVNAHDNPVDKASRGCVDDLYDQGWARDPPGDLSIFFASAMGPALRPRAAARQKICLCP
eukprot:2730902-Pyramimonas_sp.AAC.1